MVITSGTFAFISIFIVILLGSVSPSLVYISNCIVQLFREGKESVIHQVSLYMLHPYVCGMSLMQPNCINKRLYKAFEKKNI